MKQSIFKFVLLNLFAVFGLYAITFLTPFINYVQAAQYNVLHNISDTTTEGAYPQNIVISGTTIYGVTTSGGVNNTGAIFSMDISGAGYHVLYNFPSGYGPGGSNPTDLEISGSTLYGSTMFGGNTADGTVFNPGGGMVFSINTDASAFTILHSFALNSDFNSVVPTITLYGSKIYGFRGHEDTDQGAAFSMDINGSNFQIIYSFSGYGYLPSLSSPVVDGLNMYGSDTGSGVSGGSIFAINLTSGSLSTLHPFTGTNNDGYAPAGLMLSGPTLYGVTQQGGSSGNGTLFSVSTGGYSFQTLHSFTGGNGGGIPKTAPIIYNSILYGASEGGQFNNGILYSVKLDGTNFNTMHAFAGSPSDGKSPNWNSFVLNNSTFYSTTEFGGNANAGVIFSINPNNAPNVTAGPDDGGSSDNSPTITGNPAHFKATAVDTEGDSYYLAVCDSLGINIVSNGPPTCQGNTWGISALITSGAQATVDYPTTTADIGSHNWTAYVCDYNQYSDCSKPLTAPIGPSNSDDASPFVVANSGGGGSFCGNLTCEPPENSSSCPSDCTTSFPTISNMPFPQTAYVGDTLMDSANISGLFNPDGTGSITFNLYGPNDTSCLGPIAFTSTTYGIFGDGNYSTPGTFTVNAPGTWYWIAIFSGDSNNSPVSTFCGEAPIQVSAPTITIHKNANGGSSGSAGSFRFNYSGPTSGQVTVDTDSTGSGYATIPNPLTGTYVITEEVPLGWVSDYSSFCSPGSASTFTNYASVSLNTSDSPNQIIDCYFNNFRPAAITVTKVVNSSVNSNTFHFYYNPIPPYAGAAGDFYITTPGGSNNSNYATIPGLDPNSQYEVTEDTSGLSLSDWTTDDTGCSNLTLTPGAVSSCTITNTYNGGGSICGNLVCEPPEDSSSCPSDCGGGGSGTLIINKTATGNSGTFGYNATPTSSGPSISINPIPITGSTGGGGNTTASIPFNTGDPSSFTYSLTESYPSGWTITGTNCNIDGTPIITSLSGNTLSGVRIENGRTTTCNFSNSYTSSNTGSITVYKNLVNGNSAGSQTFHFTAYEIPLATTYPFDITTNSTGSGNHPLTGLPDGSTWQITEDTSVLPANITFTSSNCGSITATSSAPSSCTITNTYTPPATIRFTLNKYAISDLQTALLGASFTFTGTSTISYVGTYPYAEYTDYGSNTVSLLPGTYTITETTPGWKLRDISCSNVDSWSPIERGVTFTISLGNNNPSCTFTNVKLASVVITKYVYGSSASIPVTFIAEVASPNLPGATGTPTATQTVTAYTAYNGYNSSVVTLAIIGLDPDVPWNITEDTSILPTGYSFSSSSCINPVTLPSGSQTSCGFVNNYTPPPTGSILVNKSLIGGGSQTFHFLAYNSLLFAPITFDITTDSLGFGSRSLTGLPEGSAWTIIEDTTRLPPNVTYTRSTCGIVVASSTTPGTCTITNTYIPPTVRFTLYKNAIGDELSYPSAISNFTFSGPIPSVTTYGGHGYNTANLLPNTYTIQENPTPGWKFESASCSGVTSSNTISNGVLVTLSSGNISPSCAFNNKKLASVTITKTVNGSSASIPVRFKAEVASPNPSGAAGTPTATQIIDRNTSPIGSNMSGVTFTITGLDPDVPWNITEDTSVLPTNYSFVYSSCINPMVLTAGSNTLCSFVNNYTPPVASFTLAKEIYNPNNDSSFTFDMSPLVSGFSPTITTSGGYGNQTFNLSPGTSYTFAESLDSGWKFESVSCNFSSSNWGPSLLAGSIWVRLSGNETNPTCTFNNKKRATITVTKNAVWSNGVFNFQYTDENQVYPIQTFSIDTSGADPTKPNPHVITGLDPDIAWQVLEVMPLNTGWTQTGENCSGPLAVSAGADTPCSITNAYNTNTDVGTLKINKVAVGHSGTFGYIITPETTEPPLGVPAITIPGLNGGNANTSGTVTFTPTSPTSYTYDITEDLPLEPGWTVTNATCDTGTTWHWNGSTIITGVEIFPNIPTTCTFTNTFTKASPTLTTTPVPQIANIGDGLYDDATLSGGNNPTGTLTYYLFDPNDSPCEGSPRATLTTSVSGNGTYASPTFGPTNVVGNWNWVVEYSGDSNNNTASSSCGDELVNITAQGNIIIQKVSYDYSGTFGYSGTATNGGPSLTLSPDPITTTPNSSLGYNAFSANTSGTINFGPLAPLNYNYNLTELLPSGWSVSQAYCYIPGYPNIFGTWDSATNTLNNVPIERNQTTYCIFKNIYHSTGSITVIKNASGSTGGDVFPFTYTGPQSNSFSITTSSSGTGSETLSSLPSGSYQIIETPPPGWLFNSFATYCTPGYWAPTSNGVAYNLSAGENATCYIYNDSFGSLKVTKDTGTQDSTGVTFSFTAYSYVYSPISFTIQTSYASGSYNGSYTIPSITPGTTWYVVENTPLAGWTETANSCQSISITAGYQSTCTIANEGFGTITVNKTLSPSSDPGLFNLQIDGTTQGTGANVGDGGSTGPIILSAGTHTIGETASTGTNQSDYTTTYSGDCGDSITHQITLVAGQSVNCTITNTKKTTLTVNKTVVPSGDTGRFNLQIDGSTRGTGANVGSGGTTGQIVVSAGPHYVRETAAAGTNLNDYEITYGGDCDSSGNVITSVGDNKTCIITNTRITSLKIIKNTIGGNSSFSFTASMVPYIEHCSISTQENTGSCTIENITPGTWTVSEDIPLQTGWTQTSSTCDSINVAADASTSCTIENSCTGSSCNPTPRTFQNSYGESGTNDQPINTINP